MYFILVPLALGAVCVAFFIVLFAAGALVGLGSSGVHVLRAAGGSRDVQAKARLPKATLRSAFPPAVLQARTAIGAGAAYAAA
jgi:hypothetical protein